MSAPSPATGPAAADLTGSQVGRYAIRARLGAGGMGEVYRAMDTQLHRTVALKRVGARFRNDQQYRGFLLTEARRASSINNPHIAAIYDVLENGEDFFVVMEFVDGVTLRKRMETSMSTPEFLKIAIQCARGLSAAHEQGIVHGDIKPENIMVMAKAGGIKLCDFGLARKTAQAYDADASTTTDVGIFRDNQFAGTPAYMSPEGFSGGPVTARSDVFSLGVTFYEMLSGRNPFRGNGLAATAQSVVSAAAPPLEGIPPRIAAVVSRMIAKDPEHRYANATELLDVLEKASTKSGRRMIAPITTILALAAAVPLVFWTNHPAQAPAPPPIRNLVILPFSSDGSTPTQRFQSDGLTDILNATLVKLGPANNLQVLPITEVQKQNVKTPEDALKELGATLVLTGKVQYSDTLVRVNSILLDARTGKPLRAEVVTVESGKPFELQDRIAEAAVGMLGIRLRPVDQAALQQHGTTQPGAYEFYLQGRGYLLNFDRPENLDLALELFRSALQLDQGYALAYAGLGQAYWMKFEATKTKDLVARARAACERAVSIASNVAEGHLCLGTVYNGTGEYQKAVIELNRSLELQPTMDIAYRYLGQAYERLRQPEDAARTYQRAIDLRPQYWAYYAALGGYHYRAAHYDKARQMFLQVVRLAPDSFRGYYNLGAMYHYEGRNAEAIKAFEKSLAIRPNNPAAANLGTLRFYEGDYAGAAAAYRQALSLDKGDYSIWGNLGAAAHWAGQSNESIEAYREAERRAQDLLKVNPRNATILMYLAEYNGELGSHATALSYLKRALELAPEDPTLLFKAALVYDYALKERDNALLCLRKAVERGYSWKEIDRSPSLSELRKDSRFAELRNSH